MSVQTGRSPRLIIAALVVAMLVVGFGAGFFLKPPNTQTDLSTITLPPTTYTTTQVVTSTLTQTSTITHTVTAASTLAPNVYELVFRQITPCPNIGYFAPWSVTLSHGQSVTALNANFSQPYSGSPNNPSIITFLVGNGNYSYSVTPPNRFTPGAGTVAVDNQEAVVNLAVFMASCGSSTTTSTG